MCLDIHCIWIKKVSDSIFLLCAVFDLSLLDNVKVARNLYF